jgi:hypothetical protein
MKMKKQLVLVIFTAFLMSGFASAQSNTEEVDFYQSIFGMGKKEAVEGFLQMEASDPFWAIYDEYEAERKTLGKERLDLLKDYVDNYAKLSDEKTDELVKQAMSQNGKFNKLIKSYHKKIKKTSGSKIAAQFYQFENYILGAIRMEVMDNIPFIGELDN